VVEAESAWRSSWFEDWSDVEGSSATDSQGRM
jgi:hypothetical protein